MGGAWLTVDSEAEGIILWYFCVADWEVVEEGSEGAVGALLLATEV